MGDVVTCSLLCMPAQLLEFGRSSSAAALKVSFTEKHASQAALGVKDDCAWRVSRVALHL